ncbi:MAG: hypothetical protein AMJ81_05110 [Phycisphaerae bacterium SM23_33]|nr:MAG: hypothetical protein AMJ81_05110 [Phycisphaerae bacterium SM23_33]
MLVLAVGACGMLSWPRCLSASVVNPHLATDRSVDTRSAKSIVRDLVNEDMTDEQKALALFHWLRRVIYHSGPEEPMRHDFNLMVNVFGYGSCYMQTHPLSHLFNQLGWPCRNWVHNGHHMIEVHYDGDWHCFDPHMTFYVYNRAQPRAIASVAELRKDRTLAFEAVKENRAGPALLICGDSPNWFSGDEGWRLDQAFLAHRGADREFGAITLPRGTRYVRTWKTGTFYQPHAFGKDGVGPYHTCGAGSDRRDQVNFPYWEPYLWKGKASSHRHHGTGYIEYEPDLRGEGWKDGAIRFINLGGDADAKRPALHPLAGGIESEAIFSVTCPYILTAGVLQLAGRIGEQGDSLKVSVSSQWAGESSQRRWKDVVEINQTGAFERKQDISSLIAGSLDGLWLRVAMQARDPRGTGLDGLKLHADFQLNPYALPQLLPGRNKLLVTAARCDRPWKLRLAWSEGQGWNTPKEYKAAINGTSHEAVVEAAGPNFPRMQALEFSVDP